MCSAWRQKITLLLSLLIHLSGIAQKFANKEFYLVDSLDLKVIPKENKKILDSCLVIYHQENIDTVRFKILREICENLSREVRPKYDLFKLKLIKEVIQDYTSEKNLKYTLKPMLATALNDMGEHRLEKGNILDAMSYNKRALNLQKEIGQKKGIAVSLNNIGNIYKHQGEVIRALKYYNASLKYDLECNNIEGINPTLSNIGGIYVSQENYQEALRYYEMCWKLGKRLQNKVEMAISITNIGNIYSGIGDYDRAMKYSYASLKINSEIGFKRGKAANFNNLAFLYYRKNNFSKALIYFQKSLRLKRELGSKRPIAVTLNNLGTFNLEQGSLDKAEKYSKESLKLSRELGFPYNIKNAAITLTKIYERQNRLALALEMNRLSNQMNDSINNVKITRELTKQESKYALEKRDKEIKFLNKEKELKNVQLKLSVIIYSLLLCLLITLGMTWYKYKKSRYEKELSFLRAFKRDKELAEATSEIISIPVSFGKKILLIKPEEVVYFKSDGRYVFLVNQEGKTYIVDYTLSSLEKLLPNYFQRVHRSSIINHHEVKEAIRTQRGTVVFTMTDSGSSKIHSSRGFADKVKTITSLKNK